MAQNEGKGFCLPKHIKELPLVNEASPGKYLLLDFIENGR